MTRVKKRLLAALLVFLAIALALWLSGPRVSPGRLSAIPLIEQGDYDEVLTVMGGDQKSVASSGCGPTCVAMAVGYLTGRAVSPEALFERALERNLYFGDGFSHEALSALAESCGVRGAWIDNDADAARAALRRGLPVVAHMGPGDFTAYGHYILLRGIDADDRVLVNDPASLARSDQTWPMKALCAQLRREQSFMVLSR